MKSIRGAKQALSRRLLGQPGISGVGIDTGPDGERIKVYLTQDSSEVRALVPSRVAGYPVVSELIARVRAFGT